MKREYEEAFAEIDEILQLMPVDLLIKIPLKFKKVISENKAKNYKANIKNPIEEEKLRYETKLILGLIYRDFLTTPEEREELQKKDAEALKKAKEEIQQQYDMQNIFDKKKNKEIMQSSTELILYKEPNFFRKVLDFFGKFFKKNKI